MTQGHLSKETVVFAELVVLQTFTIGGSRICPFYIRIFSVYCPYSALQILFWHTNAPYRTLHTLTFHSNRKRSNLELFQFSL